MYEILNNNTIRISGKEIVFPCSIQGYRKGHSFIVEKDGLVIVNFYPYTEEECKLLDGVDMERNIWAFDSEGNLVWQVAPPTCRPNERNPYTSLFEEDGKLYGGNLCGYDFEINTADGSVTMPPNQGRPW